jgi:hypothetical protein
MAITRISDHVERAKARLLQQFHGNPDMEALVEVIAAKGQELEDALFALIAGRALDTAEGTQLDGIGSIVGQDRGGQDDETYRSRIRVRIKINRSSGLPNELSEITSLLAEGDVHIVELYPAALRVMVYGETTNPEEIARALHLARAAGVRVILVYDTDPVADMLRWDSTTAGQRWDEGNWAGSLDT